MKLLFTFLEQVTDRNPLHFYVKILQHVNQESQPAKNLKYVNLSQVTVAEWLVHPPAKQEVCGSNPAYLC